MAGEKELGKIVLRLVADLREIRGNLQDATRVVKDYGEQSKMTLGNIKAQYLALAAGVYAAYRTMIKVFDWAEIGAKAIQAERSFAILTKSMNVNGELLIRQMKEVGYVWVEQTELMLKAQRLLVEGVAAKDIVALMEASRVAARLMGTDVAEAFDRISEAVITLRTRGLKAAFPMDLPEITDRYAKSLGTTAKYLNEVGQRQAIVNEIVRQAKEKKLLLGDLYDPTQAERLERFRSALKEIGEEFGRIALALEKLATPVMDAFLKFNNFLKLLSLDPKKREEARKWFDDYAKRGREAIDLLISHGKEYEEEEKRRRGEGQVDQKKWEEDILAIRLDYQKRLASLTEQGNIVLANRIKALEAEREEAIAKIRKDMGEKGLKDLGIINQYYNKAIFEEKKKLEKDKQKLELEYNIKTLEAESGQREAALLIEKEQAVAAQKAISEDTSKIEAEYDLKVIDQRLRDRLKLFKLQRELEISEAKRAGLSIEEIDRYWQQQRIASEEEAEKERADVRTKIIIKDMENLRKSIELFYEDFGDFEAPPTEKQVEESFKRLRDLNANSERQLADWNLSLAEIAGGYDEITEKQIELLEAERKAVLAADELGANQDKINKLYDERIKKLKEVRELEKVKYTAELSAQYEEMMGHWDRMISYQMEALELEKQLLLANKDLTPVQREQIERNYAARNFELKAQRDMRINWLMDIGLRRYAIDLNRQLVNAYESIIPNAVDIAADSFRGLFDDLVSGTKSAGEAFRDLAMNFVKNVAKMVEEITWLIIKMEILRALGYGEAAKGKAVGGGAGFFGFLGSIIGTIGGLFTPAATVRPIPVPGTPGSYYAQKGASFWASRAISLTVGEGIEPEFVSVTPRSKMAGNMITNAVSVGPINVNDPRLASHLRSEIEEAVIRTLKEYSR